MKNLAYHKESNFKQNENVIKEILSIKETTDTFLKPEIIDDTCSLYTHETYQHLIETPFWFESCDMKTYIFCLDIIQLKLRCDWVLLSSIFAPSSDKHLILRVQTSMQTKIDSILNIYMTTFVQDFWYILAEKIFLCVC